MSSLAGEYQDRQTEGGGGRHSVSENPSQTPRVRGQRKLKPTERESTPGGGGPPLMIAFCSRGALASAVLEDELSFPEGKIPGGGCAHELEMSVEVAFAEAVGSAVTGVTWPREREAMNEASWALKASEFWMMA